MSYTTETGFTFGTNFIVAPPGAKMIPTLTPRLVSDSRDKLVLSDHITNGGMYTHLLINVSAKNPQREIVPGTSTLYLIRIQLEGKDVFTVDFDGNVTGSLDEARKVDPHNLYLRLFSAVQDAA